VIPVISGHAQQRDNYEYTKGRAMQESRRNNYQPDCPLAHDLINQLAVIVGQCDLLVEKTPEGFSAIQTNAAGSRPGESGGIGTRPTAMRSGSLANHKWT
jgi:hypothetical protein